ncbi:hypothetical protein Nepgr_015695 [Nepenthes gracilis]|uniref:Dof zinc finger protein n=1 Tax=Nepenthes gracilis TaxID=150966 RepID=A0AAD3SNF1_NEPGR|nr:hypothetical protein Nepgr_015695 [Nepenthes gracilis]
MPTEGSERRQVMRSHQVCGGPPTEPENLKCPRCDSTSTKFCYYNNYNLSQPRYFCKACRRYWTRGGTLRNVPVGGGSRRNSKRSRSSADIFLSSSSTTPPPPQLAPPSSSSSSSPSKNIFDTTSQSPVPAVPISLEPMPGSVTKTETVSPSAGDMINLNETVSFTSLMTAQGSGFLGLNSYGLALGPDDLGFGFGKGEWPLIEVKDSSGVSGGCSSWQLSGVDGCLSDCGDCFAWPDLAISTSGKGLE